MKIIKYVVCVFLCMLLVVSCVLYININSKFPSTIVHEYEKNQKFIIGTCEFCVTDFEFIDYSQFKTKYEIEYSLFDPYIKTESIHAAVVTLSVKNLGNDSVSPELYQIVIGNNTFSQGLDLDIFKEMYNGNSTNIQPEILPQETIVVRIPYIIYGTQISNKITNESFVNIKLDLVFSMYPQKILVEL